MGVKMRITNKHKFLIEHSDKTTASEIAKEHDTYLYHNIYKDLKLLCDNGYVKEKNNKYTITTKGRLIL